MNENHQDWIDSLCIKILIFLILINIFCFWQDFDKFIEAITNVPPRATGYTQESEIIPLDVIPSLSKEHMLYQD